METPVSSHSYSLSSSFAVLSTLRRCRRRRPVQLQRRGRPSTVVLSFAGKKPRGRDFGGELADESMAVLRKRIHELRRAEEGDAGPPAHWMEWEKRHHGRYSAAVCDAVAMLHGLLLSTRPSVALGVAALVAMSLPAWTVTVVLGAIDMILRGGLVR